MAYDKLGMGFGFDSTEWSEPGLTTRLTLLYNAGIKKIRVNLPTYQTEVSNTAFRDQLRLIVTTWLTFATDTYAITGYTVAGSSPGTLSTTAMTSTWHDAYTSMATYFNGALTSAQRARLEIQIGNEDDSRVDGTTLTASAFRTYNRGTVATDIAAIDSLIKKSVGVRNDFAATHISEGKGSLDRMGLNLYKDEANFNSKLLSWYNAFGTSGYLSEFGYIDETTGRTYYRGDEEYYARSAWRQMDQCRKYRMECYFFAFSTPSQATTFSIYPSSVFTQAWYALTAKRDYYSQF